MLFYFIKKKRYWFEAFDGWGAPPSAPLTWSVCSPSLPWNSPPLPLDAVLYCMQQTKVQLYLASKNQIEQNMCVLHSNTPDILENLLPAGKCLWNLSEYFTFL